MLERQLKSASLPPGLALVNAPAFDTTTEVKLSRSHSSTEQPNPAQLKPAYRRAVSAMQIEQAALASAAVSKLSAMFGDKKPQEKENSQEEEEVEKSPERPVPLPRMAAPVVKKLVVEELTSPVREIKSILKREPDSPTKKDAPRPAPKPEPRRISMASTRQRVEPVLKQQDPLPPPPTPPAALVSNFVLVSYADDSLENKTGFESPSSLDSLEDVRRMRSPSYSQMDSLERNLKMSSDSLSSSTELSSTSDEIIRPTPKSRPSWTPEVEVRPIKLRSIKSRHSDPPVETPTPEPFIRKSSSVDSIISENNNSSCRKTSSNDSLSSSEEVNLRPSEIRRQLKDNEWPVRKSKPVAPITDFLRLQLEPEPKTEELLDNNKPKVQRMHLFSSPSKKEKEQPMEIDVKTPTEPPVEEILQILPSKLKVAEIKPDVVLRRKSSVLPEAKTEECELFKVFARRSLKLNKDSDNNWEAVGVVKSRDSDKENDEELKSAANVVDKNLLNNNVAVSNNNNSINRRPQTVFIKSEQTKAAEKAARPISFSDKYKWSMQEKEIELVKSESAAPSGTASLPPATVTSDVATIKTLTPKVRKKLDQWERWAQQGGNPQSWMVCFLAFCSNWSALFIFLCS